VFIVGDVIMRCFFRLVMSMGCCRLFIMIMFLGMGMRFMLRFLGVRTRLMFVMFQFLGVRTMLMFVMKC
jgi:uncharacterized membrane protein